MDVKNIIIFLVVFFMIMWLQHNDDKKFDKINKRISLYDKIKIPLICALFVVLITQINFDNYTDFINSIINVKLSEKVTPVQLPKITNALDDIFIEPPDF